MIIKIAQYRLFIYGQVVSMFGNELTNFGLLVWLFQKSDQASLVTFSVFLKRAVGIVVGPFAGVIVDRSSPRRVLLITELVRGFLILTLGFSIYTNTYNLVFIYAALTLINVAQVFGDAAAGTLLPDLTDPSMLAKANSTLQTGQAASDLIGPIAGGLFVNTFGVFGALGIDALTFVINAILLVSLNVPNNFPETEVKRNSFLQELYQGWSFLRGQRVFFQFALAYALLGFSGALTDPLIGIKVLDSSFNEYLGFILPMFGLGSLLGGLFFSRDKLSTFTYASVFNATLGFAVFGQIGFGLSSHPVAWGVMLAAAGFFIPLRNAANQTLWQREIPREFRGRALATRRVMNQIAFLFAAGISGPLVDWALPRAAHTTLGLNLTKSDALNIVFLTCGIITAVLSIMFRHKFTSRPKES
jgi:MFS transporter, DHA3 family, macrolide efflux protein